MTQPRHLAHRGSVLARGFAVSPFHRERILAGWEPGCTVRVGGPAVVWTLAAPRRVEVHLAPGIPLVEVGDWLCSAPLDPDELLDLAAPAGAVLWVRGGVVEVVDPGAPVDPARWLDLSDYAVVEAKTLGAPPAPAEEVAPPLPVREAFSEAVGEAPPQLAGALAALRSRRVDAPPPLWARLAKGLTGLLAGRGRAGPGARSPTPPGESGWLDRVDQWLASRVLHTGLGRLVGAAHARFLREMMRHFESGDLEQALRHAIPLGGPDGVAHSLGLANLLPGARHDLSIGPRRAGLSIGVGESLMEQLRRMYRTALRRLEAAGEIEKAAFVLAELLGEDHEAIALLERHGRHERAAQIAEARELEPGLIVRLWFLAGDVERAMAIALRHHAFAEAVLRLEKGHPEEARLLRMAWAATLAKTGEYAAAVLALAPLDEELPILRGWLRHAMDAGGASGVRMLAWCARRYPEEFPELRARVLDLCASDDPAARSARVALGQHLSKDPTRATHALARPVLRALIADSGEHGTTSERTRATTRLERVVAAPLRVDRPSLRDLPEEPTWSADPLVHQVGPRDRGTTTVRHVVRLPSGRLVVALGEAGVELRDPDGRRLVHWDQPATHLVPSDTGGLVIALAERGEGRWRLGRIDLATRTGRWWCDARFLHFAHTFDNLWFVADDQALYGIDVAAEAWRSVWKVGVEVADLHRTRSELTTIVRHEGGYQIWRNRLPELLLGSRKDVPYTGPDEIVGLHKHEPWGLTVGPDVVVAELIGPPGHHATLHLEGATEAGARLDGSTLVAWDDCGRVLAVDLDLGRVVTDLRL